MHLNKTPPEHSETESKGSTRHPKIQVCLGYTETLGLVSGMEDVQDSQPLMWTPAGVHVIMNLGGSAWGPSQFQQLKVLRARRLECGLVEEHLPSVEEPWVSSP